MSGQDSVPFDGPLPGTPPDEVPKGRAAMFKVYGDPKVTYKMVNGKLVVKVSPEWEREYMMLALGLPGGIKKLYVHRLVEPYLREGLRRAVEAAPTYKIETIGCFSPRFQRHDPHRPLSDHTLGIAVDINAARNKGNYDGNKGDMPPAFVEAMKSVGFVWGGDWTGYTDPMHFQLRRL
jgi:D-alanyl-D-alanine carboxypeptidase-like protein